jgi:Holliday junction DNA helicase RuvA
MIGSLRGTVLERSTEAEVLVDVHDVGYRVVVTPRTLAALEPGVETFLHVHHHIREDAQTLYGFLTREERACFEALLGAHRVGPALALAILGTYPPAELRRLVAEGDVAALTLVPGIGKQGATRLLPELKGRLDVPGLDGIDVHANGNGNGRPSVTQNVADALTGLGYTTEEIRDALRDLPTGADASTLLRDALKVLAARRA